MSHTISLSHFREKTNHARDAVHHREMSDSDTSKVSYTIPPEMSHSNASSPPASPTLHLVLQTHASRLLGEGGWGGGAVVGWYPLGREGV